MKKVELTKADSERLDGMHNQIHSLVCSLAGREVEWNMELIWAISDLIQDHVCGKLGIMTEQEFAPYIDTETDEITNFN